VTRITNMPGLIRPMSHYDIVQKEKSDNHYKWIKGLRDYI